MKRNDPNFRKPIQKHSKPVHSLNVHFVNLFSPSVRSPILPSVRPVHLCTSACSLRPSALSVRPSVWQLSPLHPSTLYCPFLCAVRLSLRPSVCLSIRSVHQSRSSSFSFCSVLPFVHPSVPLSAQFVCPSNPSVHQLSGWQRQRQKINTLKLAKQQFCMCIALFVHFFAVGARLQRETSIFHAFFTLLSNWGRERKTTIFLFSF